MHFNAGVMQYLLLILQYWAWIGFSVRRMVRGKDHGQRIDVVQCASCPRSTHLVTFAPRMARIHPAIHAVWNGASIASWYQRQASQQAGHRHNPDPWTRLWQVQHLCSNLCCTGPPCPVISLHMHPEQQCHSSIPAFIYWWAKPGPFACLALWWGDEEWKILQNARGFHVECIHTNTCSVTWFHTQYISIHINTYQSLLLMAFLEWSLNSAWLILTAVNSWTLCRTCEIVSKRSRTKSIWALVSWLCFPVNGGSCRLANQSIWRNEQFSDPVRP